MSGIFTTEIGLSAWLALERMNDSDTFHINWLQHNTLGLQLQNSACVSDCGLQNRRKEGLVWIIQLCTLRSLINGYLGYKHTERNRYHKVSSWSTSRLVAHLTIFRLFMKGKFDAYVLWPLTKRVQNWIVNRSTARDFTVIKNGIPLDLAMPRFVQRKHNRLHFLKSAHK